MALPDPDRSLHVLGTFIRNARMAQGKTLLQVVRGTGVSRRQLTILEQGGNVSVKFLLKVAGYLELSTIPLDGRIALTAGASGFDTMEVLRASDLLSALADYFRDIAVSPIRVRPAPVDGNDASAIENFLRRSAADGEGLPKLEQALRAMSERDPVTTPATPAEEAPPAARRRRKVGSA